MSNNLYIEFNEYKIWKNMHKTLYLVFLKFVSFKKN
jgi:hypothetical protein